MRIYTRLLTLRITEKGASILELTQATMFSLVWPYRIQHMQRYKLTQKLQSIPLPWGLCGAQEF
jgi:hypothetical protein